jgi:hypothetical protein
MTNDENNRELNEFFYELATGLALPTTIPAIFDRGFWMLRGSSGATRSNAAVVKTVTHSFRVPAWPFDSAFRARTRNVYHSRKGARISVRDACRDRPLGRHPRSGRAVKLPNRAGQLLDTITQSNVPLLR